jgi:CelD/BcsL family acetyltransferase involved in cellulose biosynthesis
MILKCEVVESLTPGDQLWNDWQGLLLRLRPELRLFGPHWYAAWRDTAGNQGRWAGRLKVLSVRDSQGTLHGLLPLGMQRVGPLQLHSFAGDWQPWRTILAAAGLEAEVGHVLAHWIARSGWSMLQVGPCKRSSPETMAFLETLQARRTFLQLRRTAPLAIHNAPETWEAYRTQVIGSKALGKLGYYERRTARSGDMQIVHHRQPDPAGTARLIEDLGTIERNSWLATAKKGHLRFGTPVGKAFWTRLIDESLAAQGHLDAWVMSLDGRPISFCWTLTALPTRYVIANSYDEAFQEHRTGSTLYRYMMEDGINRGVRQFDFGDGELHYKQLWGASYQDHLDCYFVFPNRLVGAAAKLGTAVASLATRLQNRKSASTLPAAPPTEPVETAEEVPQELASAR